MHYQVEIIMPPTDNVQVAVAKAMAPFDENQEPDEDGYTNPHAFWDWYVIGGRWCGNKVKCQFDPEKVEEFYAELRKRGITVSGVQCGKPTINPDSQIPEVDKLYQEYFPGKGDHCIFFDHAGSQYEDWTGDENICTLADIPEELNACMLMILDAEGEATELYKTEVWTGKSWMKTEWDGNVKEKTLEFIKDKEAMLKRAEKRGGDADRHTQYLKDNMPGDDWLVVTVDIHS